ncbi:MAG: nucleoside permease [Prevotellaceae bacterium]|nr:nucleoside permease [Prevotellaceae bacterium]
MSLKLRLIIMNFLQFFIWGAWLISFGSYAGGKLGFTGVQIGSFFATMGIAALFMPALLGIIADRWVPAQKLYGFCHLAGAILLITASFQTAYFPLYVLMLASVMVYMPTLALSYTVAYNALAKAKMDVIKDFPPIRVWGTVGFICAMWTVDLTGFKYSETQLCVSAVAAFVLGIYSFMLPKCEINKKPESKSLIDILGLRAFTLFKDRRMAIFFFFSMLLGAALQITNGFGDLFLNDFAKIPEYIHSFGVEHSVILLSVSQISETLFILTIPFFLRRFGIKKVMLMSMFAWVLRFGFFGIGNPGDGLAFLLLSMIVYGMAFDFFNISGSLFVEQTTSPKIRASAQGVFMLMTNGIGAIIGSYAAGAIVDKFVRNVQEPSWSTAWFIFAAYALVIGILFAVFFKYRKEPQKQ